MDFYITLSSGPTPNLPFNSPTYSKYFFEKAIELDGQYEVALVQSIFKGVHTRRFASLKIYPDSKSNDEFIVHFEAENGESYDSVVRRVNNELRMVFFSYPYKKTNESMDIEKSFETPYVKYDKNTYQFSFILPKEWKFLLFDVDKSRIELLKNEESNEYRFDNSHFYHFKHFYALSNLVDDQITGDEPAQILSNFVFDKISSNVASKEFAYPQYVKLSKNYISEFTLEYRSDLYKSSFFKGTIISTLHFRKINGF